MTNYYSNNLFAEFGALWLFLFSQKALVKALENMFLIDCGYKRKNSLKKLRESSAEAAKNGWRIWMDVNRPFVILELTQKESAEKR